MKVAARREHRLLVLLQVAVVGERQALHRREQAGQPPDRRAGLAARELGDVGVQLLRHHRRAGRRLLRQPHEAELGGRPEHELLADPREVDEAARSRRRGSRARSRGRRRRRASSASCSGGGAAAASSRRARPRRAGSRRPAPRRSGTARGRGRASRPRRAGGGRASPAARAGGACSRASASRPPPRRRSSTARANARSPRRLRARVLDVEPQRRRDLVVARAPGVDLPPDLAEQPLDRRVHVLVLVREHVVRPDPGQGLLGLGELLVGEQARPRAAASRVRSVPPRSRTEAARVVVRAGTPRPRARARPRPGRPRASYATLRARAAASSVSSEASRMNPSAASCGNVSPVAYEASVSA